MDEDGWINKEDQIEEGGHFGEFSSSQQIIMTSIEVGERFLVLLESFSFADWSGGFSRLFQAFYYSSGIWIGLINFFWGNIESFWVD